MAKMCIVSHSFTIHEEDYENFILRHQNYIDKEISLSEQVKNILFNLPYDDINKDRDSSGQIDVEEDEYD